MKNNNVPFNKIIFMFVMVSMIVAVLLAGCTKDSSTEEESETTTLKLGLGDVGEYELEGITYTYLVTDSGISISKISPTEGEKIEIPNEIGGIDVNKVNCSVLYKEVKLPDGWTKIDDINMFQLNTKIEKVVLPKDLTHIYVNVFNSCENLKEINLDNVEYIGANAFSDCANLKEINLENVKEICKKAFYNCSSITTINLKNVTKIGESAFENCISLCCDIDLSNLETKRLGEAIEDRAFYNCENLKDKKVIFNESKSFDWSSCYAINSIFYNTGVNIQNIENEEDRQFIKEYCVSEHKIEFNECDFLYSDYGSYDVGDDSIDCDKEEFIEIVEKTLDGKHLAYGESVSLKDLEGILTHFVDKDRFTRYYDELAMYEFIESINYAFTGEELEKECKELGCKCDGIWRTHGYEHEYAELDKNFAITNSKYDKIIFDVRPYCDDDYFSFSIWLYTFTS